MTIASGRPIALTVAGSDSSGGAGIQADLKTFGALGVYGASAITALTAQNTTGVQDVFPVPPEFVRAQMKSVLDDLAVAAVKTGMLANAEIVAAVADGLRQAKVENVVVDPVMVATSGDPLLAADAVEIMCNELFPLASVVTPNLDEAARLLDGPRAGNRDEMLQQAHQIAERGAKAVLLKGGHLELDTGEAVDVLVQGEEVRWLRAPRVDTTNTHGTGCTLASAIAAGLAKGSGLEQAAEEAKAYLTRALQAGARLEIGQGSGPVDHLA